MASGKTGPVAHTRACRSRMEEAIQAADPLRWERHLRRKGDDAGKLPGVDTGLGSTLGGQQAEIEDGLRSPEAMTDDDEWGG